MASIKSWIQKGSFSLLNKGAVFLFGFSTYLLLVRYLDKSDFGIYSLYITITTLLEMARNSFLQNAYIKYFHDKSKSSNEVLWASVILNVGLTFFLAIILMVTSTLIGQLFNSTILGEMLWFYGACSVILIPSTQLIYYFSAELKFDNIFIINSARYFSYFVIITSVWLIHYELTLYQIAQLNVLSISISSIVSLFFIARVNDKEFVFSISEIKELFNFGKYTLGVGLTSMLTKSIDQLMIGFLLTAEAVASYNTARRFLNMIEVPVNAIANVAYPKMAKTMHEPNGKESLFKIYEKSSGYIMAVILPFILVLITFPSFFIRLVAGEAYMDAVPILQLLLIYHFVKPLAVQAGGVYEVLGKPKVGFYLLIIHTLANVILNYVLIQQEASWGGIMGAAIASVAAGFLYLIMLLTYLSKEGRVSLYRVLKNLFGLYKVVLTKVFKLT
ncbi:MAG: flippase [Reichenbachiella sp.]